MSKRDEFKALMETNKKATQNITNEVREGYLNLAKTYYGLTTPEAEEILKDIGMAVGPSVDYFEVLGLTIEALENQSESEIKKIVKAEYLRAYNRALAMSHNPNFTETKIKEMKDNVNRAKEVLIDPAKRKMHITELTPDPEVIFKFPNGDDATGIAQLATLMEKNARDAVEALYQGNLEQSLRYFGETHFANAARVIVSQYPSNRQIGFLAIIAILRGQIKFRQGSEANTPQQLARLIDQNWEQSKTLLYNGFIALWLEYTKQTQLANTAKAITNRNPSEQDIGLEELVQKLNPQIGKPKLEVSHSRIDFDSIDTESQKTMDIQITNRGRGFLYGNVQLATNMYGLQISDTEIREGRSVSVKLDASRLTPNKTHQTALVFNTNGGMVRVPIACNVIQKSAQVFRDVKVNNRVEQKINYFEVLGLSIDEIQGKDEAAIKSLVNDAHRKLYVRTVGAYANVPRPDGRTQAQWQFVLNRAKGTLLDPRKRRAYITELTQKSELNKIETVPDINIKDKDGNTPLHRAALENASETAGILLKNGVDISAKDRLGRMPLHRAAFKNASETAEVLLRHGADVNAKDAYGNTPLHHAAWNNSSETVKVLLRHGADVNAKDMYGKTPLRVAEETNMDNMVALLYQYSA